MNIHDENFVRYALSTVVIEDQHGNRWRLSDATGPGGWSLQLTMIETVTGSLSGISVTPRSGNVIEVSPS